MPIDDKTFNLNVITNEKSFQKLKMILETCSENYQQYLEKEIELRGIKKDIEEFSKKYGRILGN